MFDKLISLLQKPYESISGGEIVHKDYVRILDTYYKPPISRNVLRQKISDKYDFVEFVNEYKTDVTKLFYNSEEIKAVFNYPAVDSKNYGDSVCYMPLLYTDIYLSFSSALQKKLSQKEFIFLLKKFEPYIVAFDGATVNDMDIVEIAENLQAVKNINSVQRNTQQKFTLDVEVKAGHSELIIPKYITFEFPVFKNDLMLKKLFTIELFLSADENGFSTELMCYKFEQIVENSLKELIKQVKNGTRGVDSFMC